MPLRFDAASLMAPGGVVSGLDNLGSAVVQALNRRAERRYTTEAEARRRSQQLEDQESSRAFQSSENALARGATAALAGTRIAADERQAGTARGNAWGDKLRADKEQLVASVYQPIPESRRVHRVVDGKGVEEDIPLTPAEKEAIISSRREQVRAFVQSYGPDHQDVLDQFEQWAKAPEVPHAAPATEAPSTPFVPYRDQNEARTKRIGAIENTLAGKDPASKTASAIWDPLKALMPGSTDGIPWSQSYSQNVDELYRLRGEQGGEALAHTARQKGAKPAAVLAGDKPGAIPLPPGFIKPNTGEPMPQAGTVVAPPTARPAAAQPAVGGKVIPLAQKAAKAAELRAKAAANPATAAAYAQATDDDVLSSNGYTVQ